MYLEISNTEIESICEELSIGNRKTPERPFSVELLEKAISGLTAVKQRLERCSN